MKLKVLISSGKEGDIFVVVSPALLVSGYGSTEEESFNSFKENLETFCHDLMTLNTDQRDSEIIKLGFAKEKYLSKNFSKSYVDRNGVLQGLEQNSVTTSILEVSL